MPAVRIEVVVVDNDSVEIISEELGGLAEAPP